MRRCTSFHPSIAQRHSSGQLHPVACTRKRSHDGPHSAIGPDMNHLEWNAQPELCGHYHPYRGIRIASGHVFPIMCDLPNHHEETTHSGLDLGGERLFWPPTKRYPDDQRFVHRAAQPSYVGQNQMPHYTEASKQ